jgi:hypothetical protein
MLEALVGMIVGAVGTIITETLRPFISSSIRRHLDAPKMRFKLPIDVTFEDLNELAEIKYRLVSYGFDEMLSRPGTSEKLKHEGIWQNEDYPVDLVKSAGGKVELDFRIRVHRVIGTQFKLFAVSKAAQDAAKIVAILEACPRDVTVTSPRPADGLVWFLLNPQRFPRFRIVGTHGGNENNLVMREQSYQRPDVAVL